MTQTGETELQEEKPVAVTLSNTHPARTGLGSSLSLCSDRAAIGRLNHDAAPFSFIIVMADTYLTAHKL
jgi:hypothetical protein